MCTLVLAHGLWPSAPLLVAANRDEAWRRKSESPRPGESGARRIYAPRDIQAGGTWLGVNDAGLFVGITNRFGAPPDARKRSRGLLVMEALAASTRDEAIDAAFSRGARAHNPFHLAVADTSGVSILWDDGRTLQIEHRGPGVHVLTERSLGAVDHPRDDRLGELDGWLRESDGPPLDELHFWLSGHGEDPLDGPCVHAPQWEYGTRSSTILWFTDGGNLGFHWAGAAPCEARWDVANIEASRAIGRSPA